MFADHTELLFLEECCNLTLDPSKGNKYQFMRETYSSYIQGKSNIWISKNPEILDSCILEKLRYSTINPAIYLVKSQYNINDLEGKPWYNTPEITQLTEQLRNLVSNYLITVLQYPDQFSPQRSLSDREKEQNQETYQTIARLFDLFDTVGFDVEIFKNFIESMSGSLEQNVLHKNILLYVRFYLQKLHIFDQLSIYKNIYLYYLKDPKLRQQIFDGIIAKWNINNTSANIIEVEFVLGPLLSISVLQNNKYVIERAHSCLKGQITKRSFQNILNQYQRTNQEHVESLVELFRLCLTKDFFPKTMQFFQAICVNNKIRTTEQYSLALKQRQAINTSSDGFLLSLFDVMLSLSNKISSRSDDTYQKIDPNFWLNIPFEGETMLLNSEQILQKQNNQVGNVSYLYFYTLKLLQVCHNPILLQLKEFLKLQDELKEHEKAVKGTVMEKKFQQDLEQLDMKIHQLELSVFNHKRVKDVIQLLDTQIYLIESWIGQIKMIDGQCQWQPNNIFKYLPEFLINNIFNFNDFYMQYFENYGELLTIQKFVPIIRLSIYLMHLPIAQNKYLAGNFIELIFLYTKVTKKQLNIHGLFCSDELIKQNFLIGLLQQYYFVGATGANNQFYVKFSYRFYINDLLIQLFKTTFYQEQFRNYKNSDQCYKLINAVIGDMNYGYEEIWVNLLDTYNKMKKELPQNGINRLQQERQIEHYKSQCKSNLQNFLSNMKFLVELSLLIPDVLTNDLFSEKIIKQLNYYLNNWMKQDQETKQKLDTLKEISEKGFKLAQIFQQIGYFFANISHFKIVVDTLIRDTRSYQIENFLKLQNLLKKNIAGQQDKVEKLQKLTIQLERRKIEIDIEENEMKNETPPDKFLDPITQELMTDPVQLPQSKEIIDRKTIQKQLLEKPFDPFTNTILELKDVIPLPKLKAEIEAWQKSYIAKRDLFVQEKLKNHKMDQEINMQMTANFSFNDDDEDDNQQFKGRRLIDDE